MKNYILIIITVGLILVTTAYGATLAQLTETRICGEPRRNLAGVIVRDAAVTSAFRKIHACPRTGLQQGPCYGWSIDHVIPLACGGCDAVVNMQWLPNPIKSAAGVYPKDRWERKVYCDPQILVNF